MSNPETTVFDPFEPIAPDETEELARLGRALELAEGFTLLFARCNQPDQRQRLVARFREENQQVSIQEIHFSEPIRHLLDELRICLRDPAPDVVFVSGLENSLPRAEAAHATPVVLNLNAARNSFASVVHCPLVLWVPEYVLGAIMRGAPDFFSIRSGVYYFAVDRQSSREISASLMSGLWSVAGLNSDEKENQIEAAKRLLEDFNSLPIDQKDATTDIHLLMRIGKIYESVGNLGEAEQYTELALGLARNSKARELEMTSCGNLGVIYAKQRRFAEAEQCFEDNIQYAEASGKKQFIAISLLNLAGLSQEKNDLADARERLLRALDVSREIDDAFLQRSILNSMGNVAMREGNVESAVRLYSAAKELSETAADVSTEADASNNLANAYSEQGRFLEAKACYEHSIDLYRQMGRKFDEAETLCNLALLMSDEGNNIAALEFLNDAKKIILSLGDRNALESVEEIISIIQSYIS